MPSPAPRLPLPPPPPPPTAAEKRAHILQLLQLWYQRAKDASWLQSESAGHARLINYAFMLPMILMSTAAGAINLTSITLLSDAADDAGGASGGSRGAQLAAGILGIVTATAATVYNFMGIAQRQEQHAFYAGEFEKLSREILVESMLFDTEAQNYTSVGVLLRETQETFDRLTDRAPGVPAFIERRLERAQAKAPVAAMALPAEDAFAFRGGGGGGEGSAALQAFVERHAREQEIREMVALAEGQGQGQGQAAA
jgi:hypothetical protein